MNKVGRLILESIVILAIASFSLVNAQAQDGPPSAPGARKGHVPQEFVVCTGWHALCSASFDCRVISGDRADCDCMRVNETHIVLTSDIQDPAVKRLTLNRCTEKHPCEVDQAPVCEAIRSGRYQVDHVKYEWISTFSFRGWCSLLKTEPQPCDQTEYGYSGDLNWAVCDGAPCSENPEPFDPERPLTCQCRIQDGPFVGINGGCTGDLGGIMSSSPLWTWDFQANTYVIPVPGLDFVQSACAPLESDPFQEERLGSEPADRVKKSEVPGETFAQAGLY